MYRIFILLFFLYSAAFIHAQCDYRSPIDSPIRLSGSFGELRSTHFHAGIDIKSPDGLVGHPVRAVCDALISRIAVSPSGYGNVLYLDHDDGYRSVYAHLHRFNPILDSLVRDIQYATQRFKIDSSISHLNIRFDQGELIGYLGNSGYSFGPHLHFEIRKKMNDTPIHPQYFGFLDQDSQSPVVRSIKLYGLNADYEEISQNTIQWNKTATRINLDTVYIPAWRGAIGVDAYDPGDLTQNKNGIFRFNTYVDDVLIYSTQIDSLDINEKNEIKAYIDYSDRKNRSTTIQKGYRYPSETYSVYVDRLQGVFSVFKNKPRQVRIELEDFQRNKTEITAIVLRSEPLSRKSNTYQYLYRPDTSLLIQKNGLTIALPPHCTATPWRFSVEESVNPSTTSFQIGYDSVAILNPGTLTYTTNLLTEKHRWVYKNDDSWETIKTIRNGDQITCSLNKLGNHAIILDTICPEITWESAPSLIKLGSKVIAKINYPDNHPRDSKLDYSLNINGEWALLHYDPRTDLLTHVVDKSYPSGELEFNISVTDDVQNSASIQKIFKSL